MSLKEAMKEFDENAVKELEKHVEELRETCESYEAMLGMAINLIAWADVEHKAFEGDPKMELAEKTFGASFGSHKNVEMLIAASKSYAEFLNVATKDD